MVPTPQITGTVASPAGTLKVETSIVLKDEREIASSNSNDNSEITPTTPEFLRAQKDRHLFRKAFEDNMKNKPVKHDKVFVLLLSWEDSIDDCNVKPEVEALQKLFREDYGFDVKWETLGNQAGGHIPQHQLNRYLATFMGNNDKENTLLIIYYAGHGVYENNSVHWQARTSQRTQDEKYRDRIAWSGAESCIKGLYADVLVIFDCCAAGGFGGHQARSPNPNFEFIAACGVKERTRHPGKNSFTSALMWSLKELRNQAPFTSIAMVDKIKTYEHLPTEQTPMLLRRDRYADGVVWLAPLKRGEGSEPEDIAISEHRDPRHEYIDLRFNFYRRVELEDASSLARQLSQLVNNEKTFAAKHITLLDISSTLGTVSKAIGVWKKSSLGGKRKLTSSPMTYDRNDIIESSEMSGQPTKRQRRDSLRNISTREKAEAQGACYHFRMFFHCSLQRLGSGIGRMADVVHPPLLKPVVDETSDDTA